MNADEILTRTFADHQGEAPDPDTVLAEVHARVARRRRTLPVVAAAATVAVIAIGASVLVDQRGPDPSPPASTLTASPTPTGANSIPPPDPSPTPRDPLSTGPLADAARTTVAIDTTWLPPGTTRNTALERSYGSQIRSYVITGSDGRVVHVDLQLRAGSALTSKNGIDGQPHDLTIGGRAAREYRSEDRHSVVVRLPENQVAQVSVRSMSDPPTVDLAAIGRRIAASLRFDRPERITLAYRLTYVPKGLVVRAVGRSDEGTGWGLARSDAPPEGAWVGVGEDLRTGNDPTLPEPRVAGRPVQGHPTYVVTQSDNQIALYVNRFVGSKSLTINVTNDLVSVAELYKIADGVRLID